MALQKWEMERPEDNMILVIGKNAPLRMRALIAPYSFL